MTERPAIVAHLLRRAFSLLLLLGGLTACASLTTPAVTVPSPTPAAAAVPTAVSPALSACADLPLDAAAWAERFALAASDGDERDHLAALFRQSQALSAEMRRWTGDDLTAVLAVGDDAEEADRMRRGLALAYLNMADGRLHRASLLDDDGTYATVGELLSAAEEQLAAGSDLSLVGAVDGVARGEGLARRACARVAQLGQANHLLQLTRWEDGVTAEPLLSLPMSATFPWVITGVYPSLDYRWVALTTCSLETGGPVLLLDAATGDWVDLVEAYGLALAESGTMHPQDESATWQVIGWHPTSSHLLLAVEGQNLAFWVDRREGGYQRITLAETGESVGGERHLALVPDGSGLAYVSDDGHRLERYDFATGERTLIWEQSNGEGRINYPRFCPGGDRVAFVTEPAQVGSRCMCRLEVVTLADGTHEVLAPASVCLDSPQWSVEGEAVALREGAGRPDSTWVLDPMSGEYLTAAVDEATQCRLPTFARAEAALLSAQGSGRTAAWAEAVSAAIAGTNTAYFVP